MQGIATLLSILAWLAFVLGVIWAVLEHLRCMHRIARALERQAGIESPGAPSILAQR